MLPKIADSAEPNSIVSKLLEASWIRKRLPSGDYSFFSVQGQSIGITRKTILDLLSSIYDNFGAQLITMRDAFDVKIILLEGNWKTILPQRKILTSRGIERATWHQIWNFLRTWQDRGFTLELTASPAHTVDRLNELYTYYQKPVHTGGIKNGQNQSGKH